MGSRAVQAGHKDERNEVYKETGVDTAEADAGLNNIIARVQGTWPRAGWAAWCCRSAISPT